MALKNGLGEKGVGGEGGRWVYCIRGGGVKESI